MEVAAAVRRICFRGRDAVRTAMPSAREVGIVAQRELLRNLRSTKGIAMFALFMLGGLSLIVGRMMVKKLAGDVSDEVAHAAFETLLLRQHGSEAIAKYLGACPPTIYFLFQGTLVFLPLFVLLVGFDQLAGEVQHRTIRYSGGRAARSSIVIGKALGIWGVMAVMIAVLQMTVWVLALTQGGKDGPAIMSWGGRTLLFSIVCASSYVGFASLISSLFRTPIVALFVGAGVGFAIWLLNGVLGHYESTERLTWLFPNHYEALLFEPDMLKVAGGLALFVLWGGICVAGSCLVVARRDV
jgi:ABC-type transport system involved in multi-copper enzyme maturation permease subunit